MTRATELRGAVKAMLYPFADAQGFVRAKSRNGLSTTFRRATPELIQVFDIQWDKYGAPAFVLNFGECPLSGLDMIDIGHVAAEDVCPGWCTRCGRLQSRRGAFGWFKLRKPLLEAVISLKWRYRPEEVVQHVIKWFPEVEAWWANKDEGPHIDMIRRAG
jgi:Domain of unknown function (DUF4304)